MTTEIQTPSAHVRKTPSNKPIHKFVLSDAKQRIGVIVAAPINNKTEFAVGFSAVKFSKPAKEGEQPKPLDRFDEERGLDIAFGRLTASSTRAPKPILNPHIAIEYAHMTVRAARCFHEAKVEANTLTRAVTNFKPFYSNVLSYKQQFAIAEQNPQINTQPQFLEQKARFEKDLAFFEGIASGLRSMGGAI